MESSSLSSNQAQLETLSQCIITAPNSYKLFLLSIDVRYGQDPKIDAQAVTAAQAVIDSVMERINERVLHQLATQNLVKQNSISTIDGLLEQIRAEPMRLIEKSLQYPISTQIHKILYSMSIIYGMPFPSIIITHYLHLPSKRFWPLLRPLLRQLTQHYGDDGTILVSQTLALDSEPKKSLYWINMNILVSKIPQLKLDLNELSQLLTEKLCATIFDVKSTANIIRLCCNSLEKVDHSRICISTKHRVCMSLATCFFLLIEIDDKDFQELLSYVRVTLTCMSLLKHSRVASHILCRALLERSLVYGHLFNENFDSDLIGHKNEKIDWAQDDIVRLSKENLKVTLGHRFKRLPNCSSQVSRNRKTAQQVATNHMDTPDRYSINSYLLNEAFKSSIDSIEAFSNLFVEFLCPVMFDKESWPNDDALRVINERNLSILRKFEQVPPLWDLYELIGQSKCLRNCLVLVKALLAAHLALWASATSKSCPDKMASTSRLIPPLAQSGLIPKAFGLTIDVLAHLSPGEVFSVLSDIWQYLKDTNSVNGDDSLVTIEERRAKEKTYLNKLRLFMCQHMPGPLYVRIFKEFYAPMPKMIPT